MTVEICWDYTYITAGPQMYSTIVWLGRITSYHPTMLLQSCGEPLHQTKRPKTKFWGMSLNVNLAVGLGDGGGDRQKAASCLSIVVRCGHVGWSRYKRPFKYQMLQKLVTCLPQIVMFLWTLIPFVTESQHSQKHKRYLIFLQCLASFYNTLQQWLFLWWSKRALTECKTQKVRRFISPGRPVVSSDCFRLERKILSEHGRRLDEGRRLFLSQAVPSLPFTYLRRIFLTNRMCHHLS